MNIEEHEIYKSIYQLCLEIEKLPASPEQTKIIIMASALEHPAKRLIERQSKMEKAMRNFVHELDRNPCP